MPATWNGIDYWENPPGSPNEAIDYDKGQVTRKILVAWEDRWAAFEAFLGIGKLVTSSLTGQTYILRSSPLIVPTVEPNGGLLPHPYPAAPPGMYATRITSVDGRGKPGKDLLDVTTYEQALLTIVYSTLTYHVGDDNSVLNTDPNDIPIPLPPPPPPPPLQGTGSFFLLPDEGFALSAGTPKASNYRYITRVAKPSGRMLSLNKGMMFVASPINTLRIPIAEGIPVVEPSMDLVYTWHRVPEAAVPVNAIMAQMGTVNDAIFDGFAPETLLVEAPDPKPIYSPFGGREYDIQYRMKFLPRWDRTAKVARGWNYILRKPPDGQLQFVLVTSDGALDSTRTYRATNFRNLFRPDAV